MSRFKRIFLALGLLGLLAMPQPIFACAACFGKNDSSMAQGMNAGIFSLLAVIVTVLVGAASFFVYLAKRASTSSHAAQNKQVPAQSET